MVLDVSDVIDVIVSLSSAVTVLCDVSPSFLLIGNWWNRSFFSLHKTCTLVYRYAGRDEV